MYNLTCYLHIDLILVMKMCSLLSRFAGSRNNKGITVGVVVAGVFLALVIIALWQNNTCFSTDCIYYIQLPFPWAFHICSSILWNVFWYLFNSVVLWTQEINMRNKGLYIIISFSSSFLWCFKAAFFFRCFSTIDHWYVTGFSFFSDECSLEGWLQILFLSLALIQ